MITSWIIAAFIGYGTGYVGGRNGIPFEISVMTSFALSTVGSFVCMWAGLP